MNDLSASWLGSDDAAVATRSEASARSSDAEIEGDMSTMMEWLDAARVATPPSDVRSMYSIHEPDASIPL